MCGICGIVSATPPEEAVIRAMCQTLAHRGPDDEGYYIHPACALGHRRLSIIDLKSGRQPMSNETGTIWTVVNGEIYNYIELREELASKGHRFRTAADSEVIPHAYEEWGEDCLLRFNGMFAIALWDEPVRRLMLARDRMGEKPLYYFRLGDRVLFASEPRAILSHPGVRPRLSLPALALYLVHEYVPTPYTIYADLHRLEPGSVLILENGRTAFRRYWDIPFDERKPCSEEELCERIRAGLRESVRLRLRGDVPVGIFLSGGIDSAAITAFASGARQVDTFSVGFDESAFDESAFASSVARHFGSNHHACVLRADEAVMLIRQILSLMDEPLADASVIPTYVLSRFARDSVKVALGGDGGDELLGGYPTFLADRVAEWYFRCPSWTRQCVGALARALPTSMGNYTADYLLKQFLKGEGYGRWRRHQVWFGSFAPHELADLLQPDILHALGDFDPLSVVDTTIRDARTDDPVNKLAYLYAKLYLQDDILVKLDRMSMACGLEVRAPFLDPNFVVLAGQIPGRLKVSRLRTKHVFKRAMKLFLPHGIADRRKKGFGIPLAGWFKNQLRPLLLETLSAERLSRDGIFDPGFVERLIAEHQSGAKDNRKLLWTLLVFNEWLRRTQPQIT